MKLKLIAIALAVVTVLGIMSTVSFADEGGSDIYSIFEDYQLAYTTYTHSGMDIDITSYADNSVASNNSVILYVINHMGEYPGTESDETIIADFLKEGYVVAVLDYDNNPLAVSPIIENSVQQIRADIRTANKYIGSRTVDETKSYVVPAGYRLARDVVYFEIATDGSQTSINYILKKYNEQSSVAQAFYCYPDATNKYDATHEHPYQYMVTVGQEDGKTVYHFKDEYKAETIYDIIMKDGHKMTKEDTQLKLDIVYPSKPVKETPVAVLASSGTPRANNGVSLTRQHSVGFLFRGYTTVCYDHEYFPFINEDVGGWGHFEPAYTFQSIDGVKTHTAAIRCIKYYADKYGYSGEKIGVYGHSKSSYSALLSNPNAESLAEDDNTSDKFNENQPFTKDVNGNPIDATITCCYHSMGNGSSRFQRYLTPNNVPTIICVGQKESSGTGNTYWAKEKQAYLESGIEFLAIPMIDLGHDYPNGDDPVYDYNRYLAFTKFFDYYLKGTAPEILYTSVNDGILKDIKTTSYEWSKESKEDTSKQWKEIEGETLFVQFIAPVTEWSFLEAVTLKDSDGNTPKGYWYAEGNGNKWIFKGDLVNGKTYTLEIADNTVFDKNGRTVAEGTKVTFTK